MSSKMTLGIMALYTGKDNRLEERAYFKQLTTRGAQMGINIVIFTPADVDGAKKRILAHYYDMKAMRWMRKWAPLPSYIFDRCRYQPNARFKQLQAFRTAYPHLTYLNRPLSNKWRMHQVLSNNKHIRPHLPATQIQATFSDVLNMLDTKPTVYLKPINGTGGRGILRIQKREKLYLIQGRDLKRRIIPAQFVTKIKLISRIKAWARNSNLLIQEGIDIALSDARVHDYRLLLQKGRKGEWEYTGCAGRIGANRSITSNLHGGGRAIAMSSLMKRWFPDEKKAQSIQHKMVRLGRRVISEVEQKFGKLCELALDLAVDRSGHVWLLEINPKPSRQVFAKIGELQTYETALRRPLEYALWLHEKATNS